MDVEKKINLITRNLAEVIGEEDLKKKIGEKDFTVYWGTTPTGSIGIAYFFPMLKIADFLKAGLKVKILLADLHSALDNTPWELIDKRYNYYKEAISLILKTIGVDLKKLDFVKGSSFQLGKDYVYDVMKMSTLVSIHDSKKAASEVVKFGDNPKTSGLVYPLMQVLDEEYLKVDAQFGGTDQRKIMVLARENLPKMGYKSRIELINPLIQGLTGEGKMSSSVKSSKVDLLDDEEIVNKKVNNASMITGDSNNGVMALLKYFIFVVKQDRGEKFVVQRPEKFEGNLEYDNYKKLEGDFVAKKLHPLDLKNAVAEEINGFLKNFRESDELKKLHKDAYPN